MDLFTVFAAENLVAFIMLGSVFVIVFSGEKRIKLVYLLAVALPLGYALARLAGLFFIHNQPFAIEGFEPLVPHAVDNAFPSDHTVISGVFALTAFLANRRIGLVLWTLTLLVGVARVSAGLHYPVDIIVGALLALVAVFIAHKVVLSVVGRHP